TSHLFFFSSRRRHTISKRDWSSDVCSSDLNPTSHQTKPQASASLTVQDSQEMASLFYFTIGKLPTIVYKTSSQTSSSNDWFNPRSEERRVGKEYRSRESQDQ